MAKPIVKQVPFEPITFTVSGTTYKYANLEEFDIKPVKEKAVGGFGGKRYTYVVNTRAEQIAFQDRLVNSAADVADKYGDEHHIYLAMVRDCGHI
jgi:hypothetical protein